jgi:hypothetical protein
MNSVPLLHRRQGLLVYLGARRWTSPTRVLPILLLALFLSPGSLRACSVCYGQPDSPMAQGLNWGILSLLGVVVAVLGSFAAFFIYLANRASITTPPAPASEPLLASAKEIYQ